MADRMFGETPGVPERTVFASRQDVSNASVHRPTQAGISGSAGEGADSIVVSGGYEDDEDHGAVIIYTGHGGHDPNTGKQVADQVLERGNLALARSGDDGLPVRVVRGAHRGSPHAPQVGYRYDGLFQVERYWHEVSRSGFRIWRFRLVKLEPSPHAPTEVAAPAPSGREQPGRIRSTIQRVVRSTEVSRFVKRVHDDHCQMCDVRLETPTGGYSEGAHVQPLGRPHDGPDTADNILCLCPNHHVLFDSGAVVITDELELVDTTSGRRLGRLRTEPTHQVAPEFIRYHRARFGDD